MSVTEIEQPVIEEEVAPPAIDWDVKLTYEQTLEGLKALAAERPDYVYEIDGGEHRGYCRYIEHDGTPGCIVGNLLVRNGVDPTAISSREAASANSLPFWADERAGRLARMVQTWQDAGRPWSESVTAGLRSAVAFDA